MNFSVFSTYNADHIMDNAKTPSISFAFFGKSFRTYFLVVMFSKTFQE